MTLSEALDNLTGTSLVTASDDGSFLVALKHARSWRVGFRLRRPNARVGRWELVEFSARRSGSGSMTAADVRGLPIGNLLAEARNLLSASTTKPPSRGRLLRPSDLDTVSLAPFLTDARSSGPRTDADFARLALVYVGLVAEGNRAPARTLGDRYAPTGPKAGAWANWFSEARRRGLLSKVRPGEPGGYLTAKAERLLGFDSNADPG